MLRIYDRMAAFAKAWEGRPKECATKDCRRPLSKDMRGLVLRTEAGLEYYCGPCRMRIWAEAAGKRVGLYP